MSPNESYYFPDQYLVVAYNYYGQASGIFMTYPNETYSKQELLDYFEEAQPAYLIAAEVPDVGEVTQNNFHSKLSEFIEDLYENSLDEADVKYYIPSTLH